MEPPLLSSAKESTMPRTDEEDNVSIVASSEKKKLSYFVTLDANGLDHVAKHLRAQYWPVFTRFEDIMPFFDVPAEVGSFLHHRILSTLYIGHKPGTLYPVKKGFR